MAEVKVFLDDISRNSEVPVPYLGFLCALVVVLGQELALLTAKWWVIYLLPQEGLLDVCKVLQERDGQYVLCWRWLTPPGPVEGCPPHSANRSYCRQTVYLVEFD